MGALNDYLQQSIADTAKCYTKCQATVWNWATTWVRPMRCHLALWSSLLPLVDAERDILNDLANLLSAGAEYSSMEHVDILMAGYTHLQPAQPIRFSHWLLSHLLPIMRDTERLKEIISRANQCPLGSCALAGNAFGVDHEFLTKELGFDGVTPNTLDSVSDRDFVVEFLVWSTLLLTHFSQFAKDVIITNLLKGVDRKRTSLPEKRLLQNRRPQIERPRCQLTRPQRKKAKGIGLVHGGEVGGRVLPKDDFDPEILNFLKSYNN